MNKNFKKIVSFTICVSIALSSFIGTQLFSSAVGEVETVVFEQTQTAGISGFRKMWDTPVVLSEQGVPAKTVPAVNGSANGPGLQAVWNPEDSLRNNGAVDGTLVFDAIHRSMLVRFPGFAQTVATKISQGKVVKNAYIELQQIGTELWAENYNSYQGLNYIGNSWSNPDKKPNWHAQAYALRKPWQASKSEGPTFNSNINGAQYWTKYGARDTEQDRFPTQFKQINDFAANENIGKVDITASFNDATFGTSLTKRLEAIEQNGFIVNKEEYYDLSDIGVTQYEFGTGRGMQGILVKKPKLVVEFESGTAVSVENKNYALDMQAYKSQVANTPKAGVPTAVTPTQDEYNVLKERFSRKFMPEGMPDWQWENIEKLRSLSSGDAKAFPQTYSAYLLWLDKQLEMQIRAWPGWTISDNLFVVANYQDAMPAPVLDHWKLFYTSVLNPHTATRDVINPMFNEYAVKQSIEETGDWRSDASLFRYYSARMGTMNFNYQFSAVTLIGGALIGSKMVEEDGRHGLEKYPSYYWTWYDGTTQESIDHYYLGHSIASQKMFVDFGPTLYDRTVGKTLMAKTVEEMATLFHPRLKRFISTSGRTNLALVFGKNEEYQE
jgi:hypothetical protein